MVNGVAQVRPGVKIFSVYNKCYQFEEWHYDEVKCEDGDHFINIVHLFADHAEAGG